MEQMKIEIAEPGRMTQSGSSLLKLIQNNNMPVLDLFVRESVQNSLDAQNDTDRYVTVKFKTGTFDKYRLNNELEGITDSLNSRYTDEQYEFISIMDTNTVGLTGKLHYDDVDDNRYGNLLKLIYEISKPQDTEGAGGSWGLGKTVYFRVGMGLVLYYSRIKKEDGNYESRMAACLVEDENRSGSLIPKYKGRSKRGIAWWGQARGDNKTQPVTDETYINRILDIFNIEPYIDEETGTAIVIPYINRDELLKNNQIIYSSEDGSEHINQFWKADIEDYLRIALQRWYSPRLNNPNYSYGKFLRALINSEGITKDSMEPVFEIIQALYNRAAGTDRISDDIMAGADVKCEKISLRNVLKVGEAGYICFTKVNRKQLKMECPDNKPDPYEYFNCVNSESDKNKPVITFTRKPGMLVDYETVGPWTDGIQACDKDNYILGVFVLNSDNELINTESRYSLEEYVRKGEMADHTSWNDFSLKNNANPRIVSKIQGHVRDKIAKEYTDDNPADINKRTSVFSKEFGELLLPPDGFGKKPSVSQRKNGNTKRNKKKSDFVFSIDNDIRYMKNGIMVKAAIIVNKETEHFYVTIGVDADGGNITFDQWKDKMRMKFPFDIENIIIHVSEYDGSSTGMQSGFRLDKDITDYSYEKLMFGILKDDNKCYGFAIDSDKPHKYEIEAVMKINLEKKEFNPAFTAETERRVR